MYLGKEDNKTLGVTALMTVIHYTINGKDRVKPGQTTRTKEKLAQNRMKWTEVSQRTLHSAGCGKKLINLVRVEPLFTDSIYRGMDYLLYY